ncbi:unnamed protein product [Somion occarium]|uniref:Uncharacterized protein n=1 Tax=Somion occarium TaxID=3059160 RepID=A0ABP1CM65_9APHY
MQAYHGQPIGPYIGQNPYGQSQATYYAPYAPYAPLAAAPNVPFPGPYGGDQYDSRPPPQGPPPPQAFARPRHRPLNKPSRSASQNEPKELKGILKPSSSVGHGDPSLSRTRTNSQRARANSSTRPQLDNFPPFAPEHIFLALQGTNEIRLEGVSYQQTIDDLREHVLPMWPHGVAMEDSRDHRWRAQFAGNPWAASGMDGIFARRLICRLFAVLAHNGYNYLSTVNTSGTPCRLLFHMVERSPSEANPYFFSTCFSKSGDKISIVDAPPALVQQLGRNLRSVFPNKVASDRFEEDNVYIIQMKRSMVGSEVDKTLLSAYILQFFKAVGYDLNGSLPLGRRTSGLSIGSKKEIWMFRGQVARPPSAHGHR